MPAERGTKRSFLDAVAGEVDPSLVPLIKTWDEKWDNEPTAVQLLDTSQAAEGQGAGDTPVDRPLP